MTDIGKPFNRDTGTDERDRSASMSVVAQVLHFAFALPFTCLPRRIRYALGPIIGILLIGFRSEDSLFVLAVVWALWAIYTAWRRPAPSFEPCSTPAGRLDVLMVALSPPLLILGHFLWMVNVAGVSAGRAGVLLDDMSGNGILLLAWLSVFSLMFRRSKKPVQLDSYGSARLMQDLDGLVHAEGLLIGRAGPDLPDQFSGKVLANPDPRHMVTVAANGAGKGVSVIVPNLIAYEGSVLAIDPKGELAAITARRRAAMGQTVHVLDPWGLSGTPSASFNPLSMLTPDNPDIVEDAALVTDALVFDDGGSDPYWGLEARNLLQGVILHIATDYGIDDAERNLMTLRRLLTLDADQFAVLLEDMTTNVGANGAVSRIARSLSAMPEKQFGSIRATARVSTDFLESPRMERVLARTDFELADLKRNPTTIYLCLPAARLGTHSRWLRLMIGMALEGMERERTRPKRPVVFLMDEFATLGYMRSIENAVGQIRGFGVKLWVVLQDLNQLKALYRDRWETFLGNAGTVQFFGLNDQFTTQYVSRILGEQTILVTSQTEQGSRRTSVSISEKGRSLMTPDEVRRLPAHQQIILMQGQPGLVADKLTYYADHEFEGRFDDNPLLG